MQRTNVKLGFSHVFFSIILACGIVFLIDWNTKESPSHPIDLTAVPPTFVPVKNTAGQQIALTMPVSVVGYGDDLLIADYSQIYRYDRSDGVLLAMEPILDGSNGLRAPTTNGHRWVPTGLAYDSQANLLYVANYLANNILVLRPDRSTNQLHLTSVIASDKTGGPENLALSADAKWLVSANYDSITAFRRKDPLGWEQVWWKRVKLAHGVTITEDTVYATSLGERALFEIGLYEGEVRRRVGSIGWDGAAPHFLWPTQVSSLGSDRIAIADAHTGRVSILSIATLKVEKYFGGNGPGWNYLNMPYAVQSNNGKLLVLSTYQSRLLEIDPFNLRVSNHIVFGSPRWIQPFQEIIKKSATPLNGKGNWENYLNEDRPGIKLGKVEYLLAYRHLYPLSSGSAPIVSPGDGLLNPSGDFYFLQAKSVNDSVLLWSPQMSGGVIYAERDLLYGGPVCETSSRITIDTWIVGNEVFSPYGKIIDLGVVERHEANIKKLQAARTSDGLLRRETLFKDLLAECYERNTFETRFRGTFVSERGQRFLEAYDRWESGKAYAAEVRQVASDYLKHSSELTEVSLSEYSLVQMLSGVGTNGLNRMAR